MLVSTPWWCQVQLLTDGIHRSLPSPRQGWLAMLFSSLSGASGCFASRPHWPDHLNLYSVSVRRSQPFLPALHLQGDVDDVITVWQPMATIEKHLEHFPISRNLWVTIKLKTIEDENWGWISILVQPLFSYLSWTFVFINFWFFMNEFISIVLWHKISTHIDTDFWVTAEHRFTLSVHISFCFSSSYHSCNRGIAQTKQASIPIWNQRWGASCLLL